MEEASARPDGEAGDHAARDERAHRIWAATGYHRQDNWARWVKPL